MMNAKSTNGVPMIRTYKETTTNAASDRIAGTMECTALSDHGTKGDRKRAKEKAGSD
jgi:hypothetical protein